MSDPPSKNTGESSDSQDERAQRIAELEKIYLTPPQQFDDAWLNKLQESVLSNMCILMSLDTGRNLLNWMNCLFLVLQYQDLEYALSAKV